MLLNYVQLLPILQSILLQNYIWIRTNCWPCRFPELSTTQKFNLICFLKFDSVIRNWQMQWLICCFGESIKSFFFFNFYFSEEKKFHFSSVIIIKAISKVKVNRKLQKLKTTQCKVKLIFVTMSGYVRLD